MSILVISVTIYPMTARFEGMVPGTRCARMYLYVSSPAFRSIVLRQQGSWSDSERLCQLADVDNRNVAFAPFDAADVVTVQPRLKAQLLLGPTPFLAEKANSVPHVRFDIKPCHSLTSHV